MKNSKSELNQNVYYLWLRSAYGFKYDGVGCVDGDGDVGDCDYLDNSGISPVCII